MLPITCPCREGGTRFITVVISSGIMIAVPEACTIRPSSRGRNAGETAQTRVPAVKVVIAIANTCRVENRPMRKPVIGMTTAMVSMNPVVSHCAVVSDRSRSSMIGGSATDRMVSLRITTNALIRRSTMTLRSRGESVDGEVAAGAGERVTGGV